MASDESVEQESEEDAALRAILNEIICFNMEIEVIGSWVWCFNCYAYKDSLKALGFKYAPKKRACMDMALWRIFTLSQGRNTY